MFGTEQLFNKYRTLCILYLILLIACVSCFVCLRSALNLPDDFSTLLYYFLSLFIALFVSSFVLSRQYKQICKMPLIKLIQKLFKSICSNFNDDSVLRSCCLVDLGISVDELNYFSFELYNQFGINDILDTSVIKEDWTLDDFFYYLETPGFIFYNNVYELLSDFMCISCAIFGNSEITFILGMLMSVDEKLLGVDEIRVLYDKIIQVLNKKEEQS